MRSSTSSASRVSLLLSLDAALPLYSDAATTTTTTPRGGGLNVFVMKKKNVEREKVNGICM